MNDKPKLSVIIPVYNSEQYLARCLESVVSQDCDSFEIICVNDGSTDRSKDILERYKSQYKFITIINKENGGLSSARNAGLTIAQGEFVSFIDSDDYISEGMFQKLIHLFDDDVDLVICGTNVEYLSWENMRRSDDKYFKVDEMRNSPITKEMLNDINVCAWNKLYRLQLIRTYNIKFPEGLWYEDAAFFWCYLGVSKFISSTPIKFYNYIRYPNSIMGNTLNGNAKAINFLDIVDFVMDFYQNNGLFQKFQNVFFNFFKSNFELAFRYLPFEYYCVAYVKSQKVLLKFKQASTFSRLSFANYILSRNLWFLIAMHIKNRLRTLLGSFFKRYIL